METPFTPREEAIRKYLGDIASIGKNGTGGVTRLAFSPEERQVHTYARNLMNDRGYNIRTDAFGNLIASKDSDQQGRKVMLGTHLDSVIRGGNYDGVVGFVVAIEAVDAAEKERSLPYGIDIVIFRAEESTRFNRGCLGSSAAFGFLSRDDAQKLEDNEHQTLEDAINNSGGDSSKLGNAWLTTNEYMYYFETHIEQATVLETEGISVGIVTSIRAAERMCLHGPYSLQTAAKIVLDVEKIGEKYAKTGDLVATVGKISSKDGNNKLIAGADSINTIPGTVTFTINCLADITKKDITKKYDTIATRRGVTYKYISNSQNFATVSVSGAAGHSGGTPMGKVYRKDALTAASEMILAIPSDLIPASKNIILYVDVRSNDVAYRSRAMGEIIEKAKQYPPLISHLIENSQPIKRLDEKLRTYLRDSAKELGICTIDLPSGAAHDAMKAALYGIPTAMLFVPSRKGLSHCPDEYTPTNHIADAIKVLAHTLCNLRG